jgi:glucokinase
MTISTGIGGGVVANGELVEGASYVGGEVGHMTVVPAGDRCKCKKAGCLEAYASGTAISRYVERQMRKGVATKIPKFLEKNKRITAKVVGAAAKKGDRLALRSFARAGFYLGIGIANLLNILNPELIILGGGVLKSAPPIFFKAMRDSCELDAWPQAFEAVRILRTKLGDHVGDLGALALAFH